MILCEDDLSTLTISQKSAKPGHRRFLSVVLKLHSEIAGGSVCSQSREDCLLDICVLYVNLITPQFEMMLL